MKGMTWVLLLGLVACQSGEQELVARVGERGITVREYQEMAAKLLAGPYRELEQVDQEVREKMLEAMIDRELLLLEARNRALDREPEIVAQVRRLEEALLIKKLYENEAIGQIELSDTEVELYFYEGDFDREIRVSAISCATVEEAEGVLAALRQGRDFAALAAERPVQPPGSRGAGDLGFMPPADLLPEVRDQLLTLQPGQVFPQPLQTRYGLQVVRVTDRRTVEFADRREQMADRLRLEKRGARIAAYTDSLKRARGLDCSGGSDAELCVWEGGRLSAEEYRAVLELYGKGAAEESPADTPPPEWVAERQILLAEARCRGYDDEEVRETVERKQDELLAARLYAEIAGGISVSEAEMQAHYEAHAEKYGPQPVVEVEEILVADEELARQLRGRIEAGEEMGQLADRYNIRDATRPHRGRMRLWRRENAFLGPFACGCPRRGNRGAARSAGGARRVLGIQGGGPG